MDWELIPVVIALTELLKEFGVKGKWNVLAAVLVGTVASLVQSMAPEYAQLGLGAVAVGLTSAGLYRVGKRMGNSLVNGG